MRRSAMRVKEKRQLSFHTPTRVTNSSRGTAGPRPGAADTPRRTHVRLGRAGRQRTTAAHRRRSPKSACPLSLMNLRRDSSSSRGGGGKSTGVSCARFGTQSKQAAMATGSFWALEPVPFVILLVNDTLVRRLNCSSLSFPSNGSQGRGGGGGFAERSKEKALSTAREARPAWRRVLYGDVFLFK